MSSFHLLSGLGLQLAKELASRGCKIIIADKEDASSTVKNLIKETHNPNISCKMVNFASFKSVRLLAEGIKKDVSKLDILVNNAGIAVGQNKMTEDGLQDIMQINYFSHFLLTHLLLGKFVLHIRFRMFCISETLSPNNHSFNIYTRMLKVTKLFW